MSDRDVALRSTAAALQTMLPEAHELRPAERALMSDWLDRIAADRTMRSTSGGSEGPDTSS